MTVTTPFGEVIRDDQGMRLEFVRSYDEPIDNVWGALTESERLSRWFGTWSGDPSTGTVDLLMQEDQSGGPQPARILECAPPTRLVVELPSPDGPWLLSVALQERGGGTELVFNHRLAEPYDATSVGPGWHYYLDRLGAEISGAEVPTDWDAYFPAPDGTYALPG
ncbi:MAG TPA: SRPBCC family protein [Mycobacteriales bacterium]|jgi:uncharacterized protein YndB with AHSA1/START domain|nr:SRPBCC family protein [Mycobacteriales bacterium]